MNVSAVAIAALWASAAGATTFQVSVSGMSFSPRDVTIAPGDSVTWTNNGGTHNVAADDGSFRCSAGCIGATGDPSGAPWSFTQTFPSVGTIAYHCEVHGGTGGAGMAGRVIVQSGGGGLAGVPSYQSYTPSAAQLASPTDPVTWKTGASAMGVNAFEPSIGVNWSTGKIFFQSDIFTLRVTANDTCAAFPTLTWEDKSAVFSAQDSDPILFTDHQTNRTFASMLLLLTGRNETSITDNDGDLWKPAQGSSINSVIDHETLGGGPFAPPLTGGTPAYANAMYYCAQDGAGDALCALSADGGETWLPSVLIPCGGLHGHVKVAPDGTVYVPSQQGCGPPGVNFSTNNGITWSSSTVPDSSAKPRNDPSLGIGASGTIYFGYANGESHPAIAVGHLSGGAITWSASQDVGTALGIENTQFPAVVAGDDNRAAMVFLGTPTAGGDQDADFKGLWHIYIAHTFDGGATWTTVDATPDDPMQRTCIWDGGGSNVCRNLADFIDANVDKDGRVVAAYADGCTTPQCRHAKPTAKGNDAFTRASILRQVSGKRLFAAKDPTEPVAPGAASILSATRDVLGVHLDWAQTSTGGAPITAWKVYRRLGAAGADSLINNLPASARSYLDLTPPAGTLFYSVGAVNSVGEAASCGRDVSKAEPVLVNQSPCVLPGLTIVTHPAGAQQGGPGANGDLNILSISVAEPYDATTQTTPNLVFTMKVGGDVSAPLPSRQWRVIWNHQGAPANPPAGVIYNGSYYAGMTTDPTGAVTFEYGTVENGALPVVGLVALPVPDRIAFTTGTHAADGTITITVPKNKVGSPVRGDILGSLYGRNFAGDTATSDSPSPSFRSNTAADSTDKAPTSLHPQAEFASYEVVGNYCAPDTGNPLAVLSATPTTGSVPLTVNFDGSASNDPDGIDTIAAYLLDFGDGTNPSYSSLPAASHTYAAGGTFQASLTVTDTRGRQSVNSAQKTITVSAVGAGESFFTVAPCRVYDSRQSGGLLTSGVARALTIGGACGIPTTAKAVSFNLTADSPSAAGAVAFYPNSGTPPVPSTVNFRAGQTRANNQVLALATSGAGTLQARPNIPGGGTMHIIVDVNGYFQ